MNNVGGGKFNAGNLAQRMLETIVRAAQPPPRS